MPPRLALIADDLTGALDAAAPFAAGDWRVVVATRPEALAAALATGAEVVAVSLNTREGGAAQAAAATGAAVRALAAADLLFKKVDSRLKGHVGAELAALAQACGAAQVLLCPAIPQMGRIVVDGAVTGHGIAVPVPVQAPWPGGPQIIAPDARTDADIDALLAGLPAGTLLAGARGLAAGLARWMGAGSARQLTLPLAGPVIIGVGSRDPITLAQVTRLRDRCPLAWIAAPNGRAVADIPDAALTVIQTTPGPPAAPASVTAQFAQVVAGAVSRAVGGHQTLVLTGGETAAAVLAALGIDLLDLLAEALPGLPAARPLGGTQTPVIVTKSGGFGDPDVLWRLVRAAGPQAEHGE